MSVKVDIRGLKEFQKRLERKSKDVDAFMLECVNELGARLLAKVIRRTPTGQYSGTVRFVTSDGTEVSFDVTPRTGGGLRDGWKATQASKDGNVYTAIVFNNVEYAQYVEYGHRLVNRKREVVGWQEGVFMLTESEEELKRELDGIIEKKLAAFLGDL